MLDPKQWKQRRKKINEYVIYYIILQVLWSVLIKNHFKCSKTTDIWIQARIYSLCNTFFYNSSFSVVDNTVTTLCLSCILLNCVFLSCILLNCLCLSCILVNSLVCLSCILEWSMCFTWILVSSPCLFCLSIKSYFTSVYTSVVYCIWVKGVCTCIESEWKESVLVLYLSEKNL